MHKISGQRDPAAAFPLPATRDDAAERQDANRAIAFSATGLAATGIVELLIAILTNSLGLLGDAIHNLSDVSTSAVVFLGFRLSKRAPTERYPYGLDRAEDVVRIGIAASRQGGRCSHTCRVSLNPESGRSVQRPCGGADPFGQRSVAILLWSDR